MSHDLVTYHGGAVVIVLVRWFPGLQAAPAEAVVALGTGHTEEAKHPLTNQLQSVCAYVHAYVSVQGKELTAGSPRSSRSERGSWGIALR